jgi:hypothetical protein
MMIIDICIVKATRSQKPAPNHCAVCATELPMATLAAKTIATAVRAKANASGNQRSNQPESRSPSEASVILRRPLLLRDTYKVLSTKKAA